MKAMPKTPHPHIFVKDAPTASNYTSTRSGGKPPRIPDRDPNKHGNFLRRRFDELWQQSKSEAVAIADRKGIYVEFQSKAEHDLITKSLESLKHNIRLLNVHKKNETTFATVYIPSDKVSIFLKKVDDYLNKSTQSGKPRNNDLINSIEDMRLAVVNSFWQDNEKLIPNDKESVQCEVWLRIDGGIELKERIKQFFAVCNDIGINYNKHQQIYFPERVVVMVQATRKDLEQLIKSSDHIAEFRRVRETALFWANESPPEQREWAENLLQRLEYDENSGGAVCILDTGINNTHVLVAPFLSNQDCHAVEPKWGVEDNDSHGTSMAGLVIYGDLQEALESKEKKHVPHKLESVKIMPPRGQKNKEELYGYLTKQAVSRAEIKRKDWQRVICMAVSSENDRGGRPSSWSGALDQISSGAEETNKKRLVIVAAGNTNPEDWRNYPESNITRSVDDPAQSWNSLVVGAFTDKVHITDKNLIGYHPIAKKGQLSPFSKTSRLWEKWPLKPDIVLEGGNAAIDDDKNTTEADDLSLLTLHHKPHERMFDIINATSAATAQAAWMAAHIQSRYPHIWPETVRALLIHSASWNDSMKDQFLQANQSKKKNYQTMLRVFGYGVPDLEKAINSYENSLVLVAEQEIQPFTKRGSSYITKDMHLYKMPWPNEVLRELDDKEVEFKFTLSYFVEPGPGEIGWKDRYRYPSHGLRFFLNKPQETVEIFAKRINKAVRDENEKSNYGSDTRWQLGEKTRNLGSVHSDTLKATGADLASCNLMAVCPSIGWWKERHHLNKWNKKARYSLVVSLSTPATELDLYTPVATKVGVPIKV